MKPRPLRWQYHRPETAFYGQLRDVVNIMNDGPEGGVEWLEDFITRKYGPGQSPTAEDPWRGLPHDEPCSRELRLAGSVTPATDNKQQSRFHAAPFQRGVKLACNLRLEIARLVASLPSPSLSFLRMSVGGSGVLVGMLAMFVSRSCVLLGLFVLAKRMVMLGLNMVVRGGVVMSGCQEMMLTCRMLWCLCHLCLLLIRG